MGRREREEKKELFAMDVIAREAVLATLELRGIHEALCCVCHELKRINEFLRAAKYFEIKQIGGNGMATPGIIGIVLGAVGTFTEVPAPVGGALQAGAIPTWTSDDTLTALTPSTDGTSVSVATSTSDTATSFNLTVSGVNSAGTAISTSVNVPLLPAAVTPATGFTITQTS
jgi:hypothetical protein